MELKKSWVYFVLDYTNSPIPKTTCELFWAYLTALFFLPAYKLRRFAMPDILVSILAYCTPFTIFMLTFGRPENVWVALIIGLIGALGAVLLLAIVLLYPFYLGWEKLDEWREKRSQGKPEKDTYLKVAYKSFKEKTCKKITWID